VRSHDEEDIEAVAPAIEPGSAAAVLVYENRWAGPFGSAVRWWAAAGRQWPHPTQAVLAAVDVEEQIGA
jgi:hypothetical protein